MTLTRSSCFVALVGLAAIIAAAPAANPVLQTVADVVIDAKTNQQLSVIPLGGEAGNTVYDSVGRRILVAVHGKNELVSIDPASAKIVARTPLPGIENPHGIALDVDGRLAFVAGE